MCDVSHTVLKQLRKSYVEKNGHFPTFYNFTSKGFNQGYCTGQPLRSTVHMHDLHSSDLSHQAHQIELATTMAVGWWATSSICQQLKKWTSACFRILLSVWLSTELSRYNGALHVEYVFMIFQFRYTIALCLMVLCFQLKYELCIRL
jgi:hypothetical protein